MRIIKDYNSSLAQDGTIKGHKLRGVVHSHSGSLKEALEMIELGFKIGINGYLLPSLSAIPILSDRGVIVRLAYIAHDH